MDIVEIIILVIVGLFAFGTMAYLAYDVYGSVCLSGGLIFHA